MEATGYLPGVAVRCGEGVGGTGLVVVVVGSKQATWERLAEFQIWAGLGRRTPKMGYIYLSSPSRKAVMAELAGALLSACLILGSILAHCKLYFYFNIVRAL